MNEREVCGRGSGRVLCVLMSSEREEGGVVKKQRGERAVVACRCGRHGAGFPRQASACSQTPSACTGAVSLTPKVRNVQNSIVVPKKPLWNPAGVEVEESAESWFP